MPRVLPVQEVARYLLPHNQYDRAQLVLFAGRRGFGKTTGIKTYLEIREPRVLAFDPFDDLPHMRRRVEWQDALEDLGQTGPCRRRIVPPIGVGSKDYALEVFRALVDQQVVNLLLVLDELTLWTGQRESTELETLVLQGRRLGIRIVAAIQRLALTPGIFLSEATEMVLLNQRRPRDLEVIEEWTDQETAKTVAKLQVGQCVLESL